MSCRLCANNGCKILHTLSTRLAEGKRTCKEWPGRSLHPLFANATLALHFNRSYALKQACAAKRSRGAGGGGGGRRPPTHLQTQISRHGLQSFICFEQGDLMRFNQSYALKKSLRGKKAGVGGAQPPHPPPPFAHTMLAS